jgi:hypothetical protein
VPTVRLVAHGQLGGASFHGLGAVRKIDAPRRARGERDQFRAQFTSGFTQHDRADHEFQRDAVVGVRTAPRARYPCRSFYDVTAPFGGGLPPTGCRGGAGGGWAARRVALRGVPQRRSLRGPARPVANLVIPPLVVAEVTRHSLARAGRPGAAGVALAWGWWVSLIGLVTLWYLGSGVGSEGVLIVRSGRADDPVDPQVREQYLRLHRADAPSWDIALGLGLLAAAGVLVVVLARRVASAQRRAGLDTEP